MMFNQIWNLLLFFFTDEAVENEITTQNSNVSWRQGRHLLRQ